jgi:ribosomal protein L16 Arg81 hydroxylase
MTLSVGCRAPSVSDLVSRLAENFTSSIEDNVVRRYTDEDLLSSATADEYSSGHLTNEAKYKARQLILDSMKNALEDDEWWDDFFGKYATEQKRVRMNYPIPLDEQDIMLSSEAIEDTQIGIEEDIIQSVLAGNSVLVRAEGVSFAYSCFAAIDSSCKICRLFANGEQWQCEARNDDAAVNCVACLYQIIANSRKIDSKLLLNCISSDGKQNQQYPEALKVLKDLVRKGLLYDIDSDL